MRVHWGILYKWAPVITLIFHQNPEVTNKMFKATLSMTFLIWLKCIYEQGLTNNLRLFPEIQETEILKGGGNTRIQIGLPWWCSGLRLHLPMQGTQIWSLVSEDPTCCGATKPVHHNYWACALEPGAATTEPSDPERVLRNRSGERTHCNEKPSPPAPARERLS